MTDQQREFDPSSRELNHEVPQEYEKFLVAICKTAVADITTIKRLVRFQKITRAIVDEAYAKGRQSVLGKLEAIEIKDFPKYSSKDFSAHVVFWCNEFHIWILEKIRK